MNTPSLLVISLCGAVVAGFLGGRAATVLRSDAGAQAVLDEVRTRRLLIVDEHNEVCGGFEVGTGSASDRVTLWMQRGGSSTPYLYMTIDQLEGTPEARMEFRTEDASTKKPGSLALSSTSGYPRVSLTNDVNSVHQSILLGPENSEARSALSLERTGTKAFWPE